MSRGIDVAGVHRRLVVAAAFSAAVVGTAGFAADGTVRIVAPVVVDDSMPTPLTTIRGDAGRGRAIVADRQVGLCLLCHTGPFPEERFQGTLAPDLSGAGARWSEGQLRLRIVDARALNPDTLMPPYHRAATGPRIAKAWRDKPILDAQQIEDVVAFLVTLKP